MGIRLLIATLIMSSFIAQSSHADTELAKVNQTVISLEAFNKKFQENLKYFPMKPPSKKDVLNDIIKREIGIQEAKKQGLDKNPEVIERMNTVLFNSLIEKNLSKEIESIHVTDGQAKEYYGKNPVIRTSQIFVAVPLNATADQQKAALERIKKIQDELENGKSFAEIAQTMSDGPAAPMGGDIDYQSKDRLDPVYYETALALKKPGKVSDIVRTTFGYHIIKLTGKKEWDEVDKASVKRLVFEELKAKAFQDYMNKLKGQNKVTTHLELIKE